MKFKVSEFIFDKMLKEKEKEITRLCLKQQNRILRIWSMPNKICGIRQKIILNKSGKN
jgi:hypothetical protein